MAIRIVEATIEDAETIARIRVEGMRDNWLWKASMGNASSEQQMRYIGEGIRMRLGPGREMGSSQTWKAVDEDGKCLGFTGLEIPIRLSDEQRAKLKTAGEPPTGGNELLLDYYGTHFVPLLGKHGYDPEKHFKRLGLMVIPECQRKGLGRLLTQKVSDIADEKGATTYVEAQADAAALFRKEGYEELERIDIDLERFGADGGVASMFIMKREPQPRGV